MTDTFSRNFDLATLLRLDDLDIRGIAGKNPSLTVGKYNSLLLKFKDDGPAALAALAKIADLTADEDDFLAVTNIKALLEDIGCKKLINILSDIINAIKKNNLDFAADCTKSILDDFDKIYNRTVSAGKNENLVRVFPSDDPTHVIQTVPLSERTLIKALEKLEHEEATRKLRILAVDDSAVILKTISSILSDE